MLRRLLFAVLMACACLAQATVYSLPWGPKPQFVDANGAPMSSGTLTFYVATSTTPQNTYTDSGGGTANQNPLTLNTRGEPTNEIWLTGGVSYKMVLKDSAGVTVWTVDGISGVNDTSSTFDQWVAGPAPTYVSATSFTLAGDQTATFHVGRRVKTTNSGGTVYSRISAVAFGALTTVTVVNDASTLDAGLSAVSYGLLSATNASIPAERSTTFRVADNTDPTKLLALALSGLTTATTRTVTLPDSNTTLPIVSQVVTISGPSAARTYTFADSSVTVADLTTVQALSSKTLGNTNTVTLKDTLFTLQDDGDTTKQAVVQLSGITAGTTRTITLEDASFVAGRLPTRQVFTSGVAQTYTTPTTARRIVVRAKGGGGGGGSSASTGNTGNAGADGSTTIFNSINANGGTKGGTAIQGANGGAGGTAGTGTASFRLSGAPGTNSTLIFASGTTAYANGGFGGGQGGGKGGVGGGAAIAGVANSGGGGGGGGNAASDTFVNISNAPAGGGGGEGEYIEITINSPAATYTYTVGAGGTGATLGTGGVAGKDGGSGVIIVDEYYVRGRSEAANDERFISDIGTVAANDSVYKQMANGR